MTNGIILAGGLGSRLGPLSTQISKALVSIGQRPHVFHQIKLLRAAGCKRIIVTVSPSTEVQVSMALERAGVYDVKVATQHYARGPVDAILVAANALGSERRTHGTYVLMSDTFIEEPLERYSNTWIGEANSVVERQFCARDREGNYSDRVVRAGTPVTIGAYYFHDTNELVERASETMSMHGITTEVGMGPLLTQYVGRAKTITFPTWLDIGDATALAHARRTRFIARSEHKLSLDSAGLITKWGRGDQFIKQRNWLLEQAAMRDHSANLVPRIYSTLPSGYVMEYIDLPTLSELWLYWPGLPETWKQILKGIVERLEVDLWSTRQPLRTAVNPAYEAHMFVDKAFDRLSSIDHALAARHFDLLESARAVIMSMNAGSTMVRGHGDLNFNNILYSVNTGMFKLVDPRGDEFTSLTYELAKLRYSYHAGFSAITHGLMDYVTGAPTPDRRSETEAMDDFLAGYVSLEKLQVAEGCLLLAGAALHSFYERKAMIARGAQLIKEIVG